jgi:hypothetical protein
MTLYESRFNIAFSAQKVDGWASECSFAFVVQTVGHQARRSVEGREGFALDFATVSISRPRSG